MAEDPATGARVVIRVFDRPMTAEQQQRLVDVLHQLCDTPLEHDSIARPLEAGVEEGRPYLVHAYLPGVTVDEYLRQHGRVPFSEVSLRVTHLAAAVDFAAAAGVCHGALGPRDILFAPDRTGISGLGLAQAMSEAGIEPGEPSISDDIYALAAMTYELLVGERYAGGNIRAVLASLPGMQGVNLDALAGALESALSHDRSQWPATALQFAGSLHDSLVLAGPPVPVEPRPALEEMAPEETTPAFTGRLSLHTPDPPHAPAAELPLFDVALRDTEPDEFPSETPAPYSEPERPPMEPLQFDPPPFSASTYAMPARDTYAGAHTPRDSWLPHPLTVATLTVIVLVAIGAGLFLLGDLGSDIVSPAAVISNPGARDEGSVAADRAQEPARVDGAFSSTGGGSETGVTDRLEPRTPASTQDAADPLGGAAPVVVPPPPAVRSLGEPADPRASGPPEPRLVPVVPPADAAGRASEGRTTAPGARPASEPQAPELPPGRVLVRSDPPGARVIVDGEFRGETPVAVRGLTLGRHTIRLTAPGLPAWQQEVTLTPDRPAQSFEIALGADAPLPGPSSALLQVDSRPAGAQVWVNGQLVGTTPLQLSGIDAGAHVVRLELPGYRPWTTTVSVNLGERARVTASLEQ